MKRDASNGGSRFADDLTWALWVMWSWGAFCGAVVVGTVWVLHGF